MYQQEKDYTQEGFKKTIDFSEIEDGGWKA